MNFFRTSCARKLVFSLVGEKYTSGTTNLDGSNVGILGNILILIEGVLGQLSLLLLDGKFDQKEHDGLKRRDGDISRALAGDVLVKQSQGCRGLVDPDQLMSSLQDIFGLLMRRRRLLRRSAKLASSVMNRRGRGGHGERETSKRRGCDK